RLVIGRWVLTLPLRIPLLPILLEQDRRLRTCSVCLVVTLLATELGCLGAEVERLLITLQQDGMVRTKLRQQCLLRLLAHLGKWPTAIIAHFQLGRLL